MKITLNHNSPRMYYLAILILLMVILISSCESSPSIISDTPPITYEPIKLPSQIPSATAMPSATVIPSPTVTPLPTGTMLLHQSLTNGYSQFVLVDLDYGTLLQLTEAEKDHSWPSWTTDGRSIVFQVTSYSASEIHTMAWDGSGDIKLSREQNALEYVPVVSPDGTKISFFASYPGHWALFIMNLDGSDPHTITDNTVFESVASWSPDGSSIAFTPWHNTMTPPFIASVGSDGRNFRELTTRDEADQDPVYSPDGNWIVFTCSDDMAPQICIMKKDGTHRVELTSGPGGNDNPVWSPDGSEIAFVSWRDSLDPDNCQGGDCNFEVYVMNSDGSEQRNLTNHEAEDWYPAWSIDGSQVAFVTLRDEPSHPSLCGDSCNSEIYVMNRDGSDVKRVSENQVPDWNPVWRPPVSEAPISAIPTATVVPPTVEIGGGRNQIAYWAQADSKVNIYLLNLHGEHEVPIVIGEGQSASWSPDGSQLVFINSTSNEQYELFVMNADGSDRRQITKSESGSWDPAWSPDGEFIAYSRGRSGIYIFELSDESEHLVVAGDDEYNFPAWSPDGKQLAFLVNRGQLVSTLMVIDRDGTNSRVISGSANWSTPPDWSPDGIWIAYGCFEEEWQVCKIKPDSYSPVVLTHESSNGSPSWSIDGQWISFISYRDDNWEIYIMKPDGSDQRRVTFDWLQNFGPVWRP